MSAQLSFEDMLPLTSSRAVLSPCGTYRYSLERRWKSGPRLVFVMLNPSTADEREDDPTIRRCLGFAKDNGFSAIAVVNLFALRATDPTEVPRHPRPIGKHNDHHIEVETQNPADTVVVAWGAAGDAYGGRVSDVVCTIGRDDLRCLGTTKTGQPRHPLYVAANTPLSPWNMEAL